jgi:hypothetical protein
LAKAGPPKLRYGHISFRRHTALATDGITLPTGKADIGQIKVGPN